MGWRINILDPVDSAGPVENCVPLHDRLQLSWTLDTTASQPSATFTLCGNLNDMEYMAFGLSGSQTGTLMDNGDVTIAWVDDDKARAEDYFLKSRTPVRKIQFIDLIVDYNRSHHNSASAQLVRFSDGIDLVAAE